MEKGAILIFNVNWLGDILFSTPAIRAIRKKYPKRTISCIVVPYGYEILKDNPYLDELIIFDEKKKHKSLKAKLGFIKQLKKKKFKTVFLFHRSFSRRLICYLAGIPERVGYNIKKKGFLLTHRIPLPLKRVHRIEYFLNLVSSYGIQPQGKECDFFFSEQDKFFIDNLLKEYRVTDSDTLVALNPGGNWLLKRWPKEYFASLADRLIKELKTKVLITGSSQDIKLAQDIQALMRQKVIILCGKTTLKQLGALFSRIDILVSNDSGPLHIASCLNTKGVGLFGPTAVDITGPLKDSIRVLYKDVGCKVPCYKLDCKDNRCMKAISVDEVIVQIKDILK